MSLYDDVWEVVVNYDGADEDLDPPEFFSVAPSSETGQLVIHGTWREPLDPPEPNSLDSPDPAGEDDEAGFDVTDLSIPDPEDVESPKTESHEVPLPASLVQRIQDWYETFEAQTDVADSVEVENVDMTFHEGAVGIAGRVELSQDETEMFDQLAPLVADGNSLVTSPERVLSVECRITEPLNPEDVVAHNDYTVYFETDNPHERWATYEDEWEIDTLEDYCAWRASKSDDVTKQELLNQDWYADHFHNLSNKAQLNALIEEEVVSRLDQRVTLGPEVEVSPSYFSTSREDGETVRGTVQLRIE